MKRIYLKIIFSLLYSLFCISNLSAQQNYDQCGQALELCPSTIFSVNNIGATKSFCTNCEDDFNYCFVPNNTIWMKFRTNNLGGDVSVDVFNLNFTSGVSIAQGLIVKADAPCYSDTYTLVSNCINNNSLAFTLLAPNLLPNTEYYVVLSGGSTTISEFSADVFASGPGIDRQAPYLVMSPSPDNSDFLCENTTITIQGMFMNCPDSSEIKWYMNDSLVGITTEMFFQISDVLDSCIIKAVTTCYTMSCPIEIQVQTGKYIKKQIQVDAGPSFSIFSGESIILNGSTSTIDYYWSPTSNMSNPTILNPVVNPLQTTIYYLTAKDGNCEVSDSCLVHVKDDLEIVNAFSPNGDGVNDTWEVKGLEYYPNCLVNIYDRSGNNVFQSIGYNQMKYWDGRHKGKDLPPSVYFYVIDLRNYSNSDLIKGSVTLIR